MKPYFSKQPYCLSCRKQLTEAEVHPHESMNHRVTRDYTFGGYKKPETAINIDLNNDEITVLFEDTD
jgi:hypothetical protein